MKTTILFIFIFINISISITQKHKHQHQQVFTSFEAEQHPEETQRNFIKGAINKNSNSQYPISNDPNLDELIKNNQNELTPEDLQKIKNRPQMPDQEPAVLEQEQEILEKEVLDKESQL